jgi:hypothetical protein
VIRKEECFWKGGLYDGSRRNFFAHSERDKEGVGLVKFLLA